jgi:RNA polymerase sigma factor (sigma-70 family)
MAINRMRTALDQLQQALVPSAEAALTDAQLLARFVAGRDPAAFGALLRRHGPMVLGVCRRLLRDPHDAEDAFQATFLVFVRKAASVRKRDAVGSWLYGVAYRTAREARALQARRRAREVQVNDLPHPEVPPEEPQDWRPLLDRALVSLPDKYREPLLLCDLEGKRRKEVALALGLPEGTLSSRLATARQLLARRLARAGLALSGAALLAEARATACVPAGLFHSTTKAAMLLAAGHATLTGAVPAPVAALTEGVLKTMFLLKLKSTAVVLCGVAAVGLATGGMFYQARAGGADSTQPVVAQAPAKTPPADGQRPERPKAKDLRRVADEAQARERELRDQLEALRRELDSLKAEAARQREQAEAARRQAEEAARHALAEAERALAAEGKARQQAADTLLGQKKTPQQRVAGQLKDEMKLKTPLTDLQAKQDQERRKFELMRADLQERLHQLDVQQKQWEADMERQRTQLLAQKPQPQAGSKAPVADKLDLILERLDRLEKRIENIERTKR